MIPKQINKSKKIGYKTEGTVLPSLFKYAIQRKIKKQMHHTAIESSFCGRILGDFYFKFIVYNFQIFCNEHVSFHNYEAFN
jgi:hypothetical protein